MMSVFPSGSDARDGAAITFSVILPTQGRATLRRTLRSIGSQRGGAADVEVVVVADRGDEAARRIFAEEAADYPNWRFVEHPATSGGHGYPQRGHCITVASGDYLLFIDDDDVYTPRAFHKIRNATAAHPGRILVFRMDINGTLRWKPGVPALLERNVGMEMVAIPNVPGRLGTFEPPLRYESDFDFIAETVALQDDPVWLEDVIAIFNQPAHIGRPRTGGSLSRLLFRVRTGTILLPLRARLRIRPRLRSLRTLLRRSKDLHIGPR